MLNFLLHNSIIIVSTLLECFEHILVVKKCVRELISEVLVIQEHRDTSLNDGHLKNAIHGWSASWVFLKHRGYQGVERR